MQPVSQSLENKLINAARQEKMNRFVVGAIIFRKHAASAEILILKRNRSDFFGGIDELPSGKVEKNESLAVALYRETKEETNLEISQIYGYLQYFDYASRRGDKTRQFNFVVAIKDSPVKVDPKEHYGFAWVAIENLSKTKLTDNVINLIFSNQDQLIKQIS